MKRSRSSKARARALEKALRQGMEDAAEDEEYESAADYRDQIQNLEMVTSTQVVDEAGPVGIGMWSGGPERSRAHGILIQVRGGKMIAIRHYHLQNTDPSLADPEMLCDFLAQYYVQADKDAEAAKGEGLGTVPRASEVLLPTAPEDSELLEKSLQVSVRVPETTEDEQLLGVARTNAEYALEQAANADRSRIPRRSKKCRKSSTAAASAADRVLRHLQYSGRGGGRLARGLHRGLAGQEPLSPL